MVISGELSCSTDNLLTNCLFVVLFNERKENHGTRRRQFYSLRATGGKTPPEDHPPLAPELGEGAAGMELTLPQ